MKISNNIYPDNFSIEFTKVGAKLRYSLRLDKKTANSVIRNNHVLKTRKGTYVFHVAFISNTTNEEIRATYHILKKKTMIKCRELKRKALLQEINYIQTKLKF